MMNQPKYLFDGSVSQWSRLGYAERKLQENTCLTVIMTQDYASNGVTLSVHEPRLYGGQCLIEKTFSHWSIDSASDWLHKLASDYASWQ